MLRVYILISGQVTGVGFRYFMERNAKLLGVGGWVKNAGDNVEAEFEGEEEKIKKMLEICQKGPPAGWVREVKVIKKEQIMKIEEEFKIVF
ncbi:acylphosphatase [Candidatus Gottesmanbacteria bacterium]|nr:acylphosphatase [Candidatus Gottesmanbacteria bacterium]